MPQYTIKLNTYDPAIVEAFERLRKSRKQTAFTHEALKYFLASERGVQVIELMGGDLAPLSSTTHDANNADRPQDALISEQIAAPLTSRSARDSSADVLEDILK